VEKLSRREREKLNRRREILQAAWAVFASKDYDSATIDNIAEAAELSKGTLYLYFRGKADLFLSAVEMGLERLGFIINEAVSSSDDHVVVLKEIIKQLLMFSENNPDFFKIMASEQAHFEIFKIHADMENCHGFMERVIDLVSHSILLIADHIQNGIEKGVFRQVDPRDTAFILMSSIRGLAFRRFMEKSKTPLTEKVDDVIAIFLDGLIENNRDEMA
jgi:AcrR family transcriptional regulator